MACINMYNPDGGAAFGGAGQPGPRISFSSDFSMEPPPPVQNRAMGLRCQDQEDQNFEFSVGSHPMMAADQLFSKGRILPFKAADGRPPTTLRDELVRADDDRASAASPRGSSRWREMLGLRKSLCVGGANAAASNAKKSDRVVALDADMATDIAASSKQDL
ncbi:uncharacterized protein LOC100836561 [Brachypodium distachyon]|uniref:Uncharacterized protein n=1 Tax=Brachypodium distachyon TaxID=15368 RepID=I1IEW8_BRADI|nr:uncharacterized protein LOC100836561 [Brachypodium distachyon]KQK01770.1 hypothetical protein BRADI_3g58100v3 [Brachypodium distachyon]|eukprot:XP_003570576.1 uncharacterized protein LOC100836561 [Brachypodium distachyon]